MIFYRYRHGRAKGYVLLEKKDIFCYVEHFYEPDNNESDEYRVSGFAKGWVILFLEFYHSSLWLDHVRTRSIVCKVCDLRVAKGGNPDTMTTR